MLPWPLYAWAARALCAQGVGDVVLKRGSHGALWIRSEGEVLRQPAFPVEVADITAAGDTFTAALALSRAQGFDRPTSLKRAAAAGALAVTVVGAQPSLPTHEELERFLADRA